MVTAPACFITNRGHSNGACMMHSYTATMLLQFHYDPTLGSRATGDGKSNVTLMFMSRASGDKAKR